MDDKKESSEEIIRQVYKILDECNTKHNRKIRKSDVHEFRKNMFLKFNSFAGNYPVLFEMIITQIETFDINKLIELLKLKTDVENNKINYDSASKYIGQKYFDQYAKPVLDKLDKK
jgi:hypothetical protein